LEVPARWANKDPASFTQADLEESAQEVFGRSWDQLLKDIESAKNHKRDTIDSNLCTTANTVPGHRVVVCDDGNPCTGIDACGRDSFNQPKCIGSNNYPPASQLGRVCTDGNDCNQGTCTSVDPTNSMNPATNAQCSGVHTVVCNTAATDCTSANACDAVNGGCTTVEPTNPGGSCSSPTAGTQNGCMSDTTGKCNNGVCQYAPDSSKVGNTCSVTYSSSNTCEQQNKGKCQVTTGDCVGGGVWSSSGISCNDNDGCTENDACNGSGTCSGTQIDCGSSSDQCREDPVCLNGACQGSNEGTFKGDGESCNDNDACTENDACNGSGTCSGTQLDCGSSSNQCREDPVCLNGACQGSNEGAFKDDGESCNDNDACTENDACNGSGTCAGTQIDCGSSTNQCREDPVCLNGACQATNGGDFKDNGSSCDDSDACTEGDSCNGSGTCVSGTAKSCTPESTCKFASTCSAGVCSTPANKPLSFSCLGNGEERHLHNRCEYNAEGYDPLRCNNQPCIKDDSPSPLRTQEGFCDCWSGWKGEQCEGYTTTGTSDNPNADGVGQDAFGNELPPAVDAKKGEFSPKVELTLGNTITVKVSVPSSQNKWNKAAGVSSYSTTTLLKFEGPVQYSGTPSVPTSKRAASVEESVAIHQEFGTIGTVIPEQKRDSGSSNPKACNYPNNYDWDLLTTKVNNVWVDTYTSSLSYTELAACGLTYVGYDNNFAFFNGTIKIDRNFFLGNDRFHFDRTYSVEQDYSIQFPRNLKASTKVLVSNNTVEFWSAVTQINFNPINQKWSITVGTAINKPYYKLKLVTYPAINASIPGPFAAGTTRDWTLNTALSSDGADCSTYAGGDCTQQFVFETHSCDPVDISSMTLTFQVVCRKFGTPDGPDANDSKPTETEGECAFPEYDQQYVNAIVDVHTGSTCPYHQDFSITGAELITFSDNSYNTNKTLFGISEEMFIGVDFNEPPALLKFVEVVSVCAYPRSLYSGSVPSECPSDRKVDPAAVITSAPLTAGTGFPDPHKITFHLNAGLLKAKAKVAIDGENLLDVQADLKLTYIGTLQNPAKRSSPFSRSFTVSAPVSIGGHVEKQSAEEHVNVYEKSSACATQSGLAILFVVIAALL